MSKTMKDELLDFKYNGRILELRLMLVYDNLATVYGLKTASNYVEKMCELFFVDFQIINKVLLQYTKIKELKIVDGERYRQEVLFMGVLWGESVRYIAKKYVHASKSIFYDKRYNSIGTNWDMFITEEWIARLNNETILCDNQDILRQVKSFLLNLERYNDVFR